MDKMDLILEKLNTMQEDINDLKEQMDEVRTGVNVLLDWAEKASEVRD